MSNIYNLFKINNLSQYDKYTKMFNNKVVDMNLLLPEHITSDYEADLENTLAILKKKDISCYSDKVKNYKELFKALKRAKINLLYYKTILSIEKNSTVKSTLLSFKPVNGYANLAKYEMFKTITGRLVNKESSRILTLPSKYRKIFESLWGNEGKIISIDFKTLEPRIARKLNGQKSSNDIYEELSNDLDYKVDRSIIKRAVISILYGSNAPLKELSKERSDAVLSAVKDYFNLDSLLRIADNCENREYRINYFGRPLHNLDETNNNKIINNLIQSSAVDVALTYFYNLVKTLDTDMCRPLFIIHDAIVFDVKLDYLEKLKIEVEKGYDCQKLGNFPLELTNLFKEQ